MKRILVLADLHANKVGSMEEFDMFLARELRERGNRCFLCFIGEPDPRVRKMLEEAGAQIADIFHGTACSAARRAWKLFLFIQHNDIDLVHINFYSLTDPCLAGAYLSKARIVFTEHTSGSIPKRGLLKQALSWATHIYIRHRISKYIAVSDFVRSRLEITHHITAEQSVTIYNGVNLERFAPRDRTLARVQTGLSENSRIVVAVAMLIQEKGLGYLLEAAAQLVHGHGMEDLCVLIIGEGNCRSDLERQAQTLRIDTRVQFLGRRSDVDLLVAAADVVAVPAIWAESFGLIIAEAMAAARPVVASRIGGIPELIDAGVTGLLVEPGDSRALAEGISAIISDPAFAQRLVDQALQKCHHRFNLTEKVSEYADLYESVLR